MELIEKYKNIVDEIIICSCVQIDYKNLKESILTNNIQTVEELTMHTNAGKFCKSCICESSGKGKRDYYLEEILLSFNSDNNEKVIEKNEFEKFGIVQKINKLESVLDEKVRSFLMNDGGNIEVIDIKDNNENIEIFIRYLGSCNGCSSSSAGTLYFIESTLKEELSNKIILLSI